VVSLYLEGDEAARKMAEELARREATAPSPVAGDAGMGEPKTSKRPGVSPARWLPKLL
jgi:hypothetical protein